MNSKDSTVRQYIMKHADLLGAIRLPDTAFKGIGTAKATVSERAAVPHHLIDFLSPLESYSAERYRADALACASELTGRGVLPLFVGGTGL